MELLYNWNENFNMFLWPSLYSQAEQAAKVEKMRQSILEGLNFSRQNHPLPFPPPPAMPFYPASMYPRHFGPVPPPQGRGRGFAGKWQRSAAKHGAMKRYFILHIPQTMNWFACSTS